MGAEPITMVAHLPRLATELAPGWTVSEGAALIAPDGTVVRVGVGTTGGLSATELLDGLTGAPGGEPDDVEVRDQPSSRPVAGYEAVERRITYEAGGAAREGRAMCAIAGDAVITATAAWNRDDTGAADAWDTALEGIRLLDGNRPPTAPPAHGTAPDGGGAPAEAEPGDPSVFAPLRNRWADPSIGAPHTDATLRCSTEDLAVIAWLAGASMDPIVTTDAFTGPRDVTERETTALTRSLFARGLVEIVEGVPGLVDAVDELVEPGRRPGLVVTVERIASPEPRATWMGVTPDAVLRVEAPDDTVREAIRLDPDALASSVLADAGIGPNGDHTGVARTLDAHTLTDGSAGITTLARIATSWRDGRVVNGGELWWAVGDDGALYTATATVSPTGEPSWALEPTDVAALRTELLEHLPGR